MVRLRENLSPHVNIIFRRNILLSYIVWLSATRTAKLLPHLWKRPQDIIYVPAFIVFGYYFAVMKLYALLTLHEVGVLVSAEIFLNYAQLSYRPAGVLALVSATRLEPWLLLPLAKSYRIPSNSNSSPCRRELGIPRERLQDGFIVTIEM